MLKRGGQRVERIMRVQIQQMLFGFDGGDDHPIKREQQHKHDDAERNEHRHNTPWRLVEVAHAVRRINGVFRECCVSHDCLLLSRIGPALLPFLALEAEPGNHDGGEQKRDHRR